jgi:hypothetical protein
VAITWPLNWAKKNECILKPHLGTAEYFAISATMSELLLSLTYNLTEKDISKAWIREFKIKTRANNEVDNSQIEVVTVLRSSAADKNSLNGFVSCFDILINKMEITICIDHNESETFTSFPYLKYASLLNKLSNSYYNVGYKNQEHTITNICVIPENKQISADISIKSTKIDETNSLGGFYYPAIVITDFVLTSCQVTQILLYCLDNLKRDNANNLWLRELSVSYPKPMNNKDLKQEIQFTEFNKISLRNEQWRTASIKGSLGNIEASIKVAHKLPN